MRPRAGRRPRCEDDDDSVEAPFSSTDVVDDVEHQDRSVSSHAPQLGIQQAVDRESVTVSRSERAWIRDRCNFPSRSPSTLAHRRSPTRAGRPARYGTVSPRIQLLRTRTGSATRIHGRNESPAPVQSTARSRPVENSSPDSPSRRRGDAAGTARASDRKLRREHERARGPGPRRDDVGVWCRRRDLNPRPEVYKTTALPTELRRQRRAF